MQIGLIDVDSKIPNLALMKLSAYWKQQGAQVKLHDPLFDKPDLVYESKIFKFTPDYKELGVGITASVKIIKYNLLTGRGGEMTMKAQTATKNNPRSAKAKKAKPKTGVGTRLAVRDWAEQLRKHRDRGLTYNPEQFVNPILHVDVKTGEIKINRLAEIQGPQVIEDELSYRRLKRGMN